MFCLISVVNDRNIFKDDNISVFVTQRVRNNEPKDLSYILQAASLILPLRTIKLKLFIILQVYNSDLCFILTFMTKARSPIEDKVISSAFCSILQNHAAFKRAKYNHLKTNRKVSHVKK